MPRSQVFIIGLIVSVVVVFAHAQAVTVPPPTPTPAYRLQYISVSGDVDSVSLNNNGDIAGSFAPFRFPQAIDGFLWNSTTEAMLALDVPNATQTQVGGLSDDGDVIMTVTVGGYQNEAFIFADGVYQYVGSANKVAVTTFGTAISNSGEQYAGSLGELPAIFSYESNATILLNQTGTVTGINNEGNAVGYLYGGYPNFEASAFVYTESAGTQLLGGKICNPQGMEISKALAINNNNEVLGVCTNVSVTLTWIYNVDNGNIDFIVDESEGSLYSLGLNDEGDVVGVSGEDGFESPFLYMDGTMYNLYDIINVDNITGFTPMSINSAAQITGTSDQGLVLLTLLKQEDYQ